MLAMETILGIMIGLGLAAACGFRVFVPLLVVSVASASGHLELAPGFAWMGSPLALVMFVTATAVEVGGYYVPWIDHAMDAVATPAAVVAGALVSAAYITGMSPELGWALAMIAGAGVAGAVQITTVGARAVSTVATGGLANPLVATAELATSSFLAIAAVLWPLLAGVAILTAIGFALWYLVLRRKPTALMG